MAGGDAGRARSRPLPPHVSKYLHYSIPRGKSNENLSKQNRHPSPDAGCAITTVLRYCSFFVMIPSRDHLPAPLIISAMVMASTRR